MPWSGPAHTEAVDEHSLQALRLRDDGDAGDLAGLGSKAHRKKEAPFPDDDGPNLSVKQSNLRSATSGDGPEDGFNANGIIAGSVAARHIVRFEGDSRVEYPDKGVVVAGLGGIEEGLHECPVILDLCLIRGGAAYAPPGSTGKLAGRRRRTIHDAPDHVERNIEDVVEHEGNALRRCEAIEDDEERKAHGLREFQLLAWAGGIWNFQYLGR